MLELERTACGHACCPAVRRAPAAGAERLAGGGGDLLGRDARGLATFETEVPSWEDWDAPPSARPSPRRRSPGRSGRLGGAVARLDAAVLRRRRREQRVRRPPGSGSRHRARVAGRSDRRRRGGRHLDDPDVDLPREPSLTCAARALRVPSRRHARARREARRDLAGHRVPRTAKRNDHMSLWLRATKCISTESKYGAKPHQSCCRELVAQSHKEDFS